MPAVNEAEVEHRIQRLRERYGHAELREIEVTNDPEWFAEAVEAARSGWIGDAGAFVTDDADRVLLIRHADDPDQWGIPGGGHEPGEDLDETARREVREETGAECSLTDIAFLRRKAIVHEDDPDSRVHMLTAVFEGEYERGALDVGDEEILEARWFDEAPEAATGFVAELLDEWSSPD